MLKDTIKYLIRLIIFWFAFFIITRSVFIIANTAKLEGSCFGEIIATYWYALYLDISTICYLISFPVLLLFFYSIIRINFILKLIKYFNYILIILTSIIAVSEISIYDEWGTKLSYKSLSYLSHPDEIIKTAKWSMILYGIIFILILVVSGIIAYNKFVHKKFKISKVKIIFSIAFLVINISLIFIGLRGGLQQIPIRQSDVYFSSNNFLNTAAVNSNWNIIHSIYKNKKYMNKNPYIYYPEKEALKTVKKLHSIKKDTTLKILNNNKPNIVLIILESWAADVVGCIGGDTGITPQFDKLAKQGIVFSQMYGTGARSDQGIVALLSGFPAQPVTSIIEQPNKAKQLACINKNLKEINYTSSFHFGGQLNYGNIKGYLYNQNFDILIEGKDFVDVPSGKLGIHDEYLFNRLLHDLNNFKQPFFSCAFTLSSHSPYDQPMKDVLNFGGKEKDFINSIYYTDSCLADFFINARKQSWYDNTLFIVIADHSHSTPRQTSFRSPEYKRIPCLLYGRVIKEEFRGKINNTVCSQIDLPATLLSQLDIEHKEYSWSKDIYNPYSEKFAYYAFKDGLGWVRKNNEFAFDHEDGKIYIDRISKKKKKKILKEGKSYLQVLFDEYLKY